MTRHLLLASFLLARASAFQDPRQLSNGQLIIEDMYLDQFYCSVSNSSWACTVTRSSIGLEGGAGIHVEAWISNDGGETWQTRNLDPTNRTSYSAVGTCGPSAWKNRQDSQGVIFSVTLQCAHRSVACTSYRAGLTQRKAACQKLRLLFAQVKTVG
jgi:hypothetical protein